ncbi:hypothetical protein HYH02_008008 [Chlamydomonas schloesseri]|uniref:Uncharacterized protein n=1 Tax=Chlamydomonas schloesseri TaxID=2026947 RepID=A0A835WGQ6_9CHLO|nr:hypothetical protein HYH02_008008 [Chlamydomonas schloesseri]|eukprot:KAG2446851.1 hypothetical protein HYH02_008008 [Chlamydomonas schloesseri]
MAERSMWEGREAANATAEELGAPAGAADALYALLAGDAEAVAAGRKREPLVVGLHLSTADKTVVCERLAGEARQQLRAGGHEPRVQGQEVLKKVHGRRMFEHQD